MWQIVFEVLYPHQGRKTARYALTYSPEASGNWRRLHRCTDRPKLFLNQLLNEQFSVLLWSLNIFWISCWMSNFTYCYEVQEFITCIFWQFYRWREDQIKINCCLLYEVIFTNSRLPFVTVTARVNLSTIIYHYNLSTVIIRLSSSHAQ